MTVTRDRGSVKRLASRILKETATSSFSTSGTSVNTFPLSESNRNPMFGSSNASPFLQPNNHKPPSRTPSLLSLLRKHEQRQQQQQQQQEQLQSSTSSQLSSPDPLDTRLEGMGLYSPPQSPPTRAASSATDSSVGQRPTGLIRHRHRPHIYEKAVSRCCCCRFCARGDF